MGRAEDIQEQRRRLTLNRQKLADVLSQIAQQGEAFALPWQTATRREARAAITRIKAVLRGWGETVDDHPDDLAPAATPMTSGAATVSGPAALFNQPSWQVQGPVINATGPVYMVPATPPSPPPAPAYPSSPAPTTPIEALVQPFPFSSRPQVRSMLETYTEIFGGRAAELAQLDAFLHAATPYALLLAPTGRGKTALLIHWAIQVYARGGWQVIFVPISIRYQTAAADVVFRTLGLALATIHGEQAQFEGYRQTPEDLRAISADYLRRPPPEGQQVLLILDGLDEAVGWEMKQGLFPRMPPAWLRVVCAARQVAQKTVADWRTDLGWRTDLVWRVPLAGLDDAAVQDILVSMGNPLDDLSTDVDFIKEIGRISAGDPLTIRMLIEALRDGDLQPKKLTAMTLGLEAFVREWLVDLEVKSAQHAGIRILLGLCAVALGPLTSDDLAALAPEVFPHGAGLKQTAGAVARVLIGDGSAAAGYVFGHPRLRELFGERVLLQHEREELQVRFVAYGERCYAAYCRDPQSQPIPTYVRQFWVAHLVAVGAWAQARMVLTEAVLVQTRRLQAWAAARYAAEGSYAGYLTDLEQLWGYAEQQQDLVLVIWCALIAASIHSLSGNLSPELLVGLVTVGTPEGKWSVPAVLEHIRQMPDEWQQVWTIQTLAEHGTSEDMTPLLAVARALQEARSRAEALVVIAPHLHFEEQNVVWNEVLIAVQQISNEQVRATVLTLVMPQLPKSLEGDMLKIAQQIGNEQTRNATLAQIVSHQESLGNDTLGDVRHSPVAKQDAEWGDELTRAWRIGDEQACTTVFALIEPNGPDIQRVVWSDVWDIAHPMDDIQANAAVREEVIEAVKIRALEIRNKESRGLEFEKFAFQCASLQIPRTTLLLLLRSLAARGRPDLLSDLTALMPWIAALTTPEERGEIIRAVREVAACWP